MKLSFRPVRAMSVSVATCLLAGSLCLAQAQEAPVLSPGAAEVVKLVQAGVGPEVIKTYIRSITNSFNLNTATILYLNDAGVSPELVDTMMDHDKSLAAPAPVVGPPPAPAVTAVDAPVAAPAAAVLVDDFTQTLAPYGAWVNVDGYGRCWRPTVAVYDASWQPYGDRGHWVYTDAGWYWNSEYAWGVAFHYGRWFRHPNYGWCWWPDTVWAPSWVTWRSTDDYCGWAPLPPFSAYRPGLGFFYRGATVSVGFDFGLDAGLFMFVPVGHFCEPHPRYYRVDRDRGEEIFHHAGVINSFDVDRHENRFVNRGIPVERINNVSHHHFEAVRVDQVPHADRQEWHGVNGGGFNPGVRYHGNDNGARGGQNFSPEQRHEVAPGNNNDGFHGNYSGFHGSTDFNPGQRGFDRQASPAGGKGVRPEQPTPPRTPGNPPGNPPGNSNLPETAPPANHGDNGGNGLKGHHPGQGLAGGDQRPEAPVPPRPPSVPGGNLTRPQDNNNNHSGWIQNRPVMPVQPAQQTHGYVPSAPASPARNFSQPQPEKHGNLVPAAPRSTPVPPVPASGNQPHGGNLTRGTDWDKGGH